MSKQRNADQRLDASITGEVQGVGFRYWVRQQATELGLTGTAANQSNGSVSVTVEGPASGVSTLLERLKSGATPGRVQDVEASSGRATGEFADFREL